MNIPDIDWDIVSKYPEDTCTCRCGTVFRSHSKFATVDNKPEIVSRKPCLNCGSHIMRRACSDREAFSY